MNFNVISGRSRLRGDAGILIVADRRLPVEETGWTKSDVSDVLRSVYVTPTCCEVGAAVLSHGVSISASVPDPVFLMLFDKQTKRL